MCHDVIKYYLVPCIQTLSKEITVSQRKNFIMYITFLCWVPICKCYILTFHARDIMCAGELQIMAKCPFFATNYEVGGNWNRHPDVCISCAHSKYDIESGGTWTRTRGDQCIPSWQLTNQSLELWQFT